MKKISRKNEDSVEAVEHKTVVTNPWGQVRSFTLKNMDGIKILEQTSNHTASVIQVEGPALELQLIQASTYCQKQAVKSKSVPTVPAIRSRFPLIDKYMDDDQIQRIACSEPGQVSARKEAVGILAQVLQVNPRTVERYFRKPAENRKKSGRQD